MWVGGVGQAEEPRLPSPPPPGNGKPWPARVRRPRASDSEPGNAARGSGGRPPAVQRHTTVQPLAAETGMRDLWWGTQARGHARAGERCGRGGGPQGDLNPVSCRADDGSSTEAVGMVAARACTTTGWLGAA